MCLILCFKRAIPKIEEYGYIFGNQVSDQKFAIIWASLRAILFFFESSILWFWLSIIIYSVFIFLLILYSLNTKLQVIQFEIDAFYYFLHFLLIAVNRYIDCS